jgi:putative transcriptional regulator
MDSARGKLLIATPSLFDFFRRSVVLVVEHTDQGAFGIVLNKLADATVDEAVPDLSSLAGPDEPLHIGGPVATESVVILGEFEEPGASPQLVVDDLGVVDPEETDEVARARVYAGHSGWGPGQLDSELEREAWFVEDASGEDPFSEDIWTVAVRRRGGREHALLATMPEDPSLN